MELRGEGVGGYDDGHHEGDGRAGDDAGGLERGDVPEKAEGEGAGEHYADPEDALLLQVVPDGQGRGRLLIPWLSDANG